MTASRRLVLFVEGPGDHAAVPILVRKLLTEANAWDAVRLDTNPMTVGDVGSLVKGDGKEWKRYLEAAKRGRKPLGAVLLLLDGDVKRVGKEVFCARTFAARFAAQAKEAGAGTLFSVGVVFARQEFESWLIACVDRLAGNSLPGGRDGIRAGTRPPVQDVEEAPRDAKGWLGEHLADGYKELIDQPLLTRLMVDHLDAVRQRGLRSFRRLEDALKQLVEAVRSGVPIVSPDQPPTK